MIFRNILKDGMLEALKVSEPILESFYFIDTSDLSLKYLGEFKSLRDAQEAAPDKKVINEEEVERISKEIERIRG